MLKVIQSDNLEYGELTRVLFQPSEIRGDDFPLGEPLVFQAGCLIRRETKPWDGLLLRKPVVSCRHARQTDSAR
jgi:hypothetical protein